MFDGEVQEVEARFFLGGQGCFVEANASPNPERGEVKYKWEECNRAPKITY